MIILTANKQGLYSKLLSRLFIIKTEKDYIPFPKVFQNICRAHSITKQEAWECLFLLRDCGFIEIVRFHGIRLCYEVKDDK